MPGNLQAAKRDRAQAGIKQQFLTREGNTRFRSLFAS